MIHSGSSHDRAFSLTELLITIGIIAILVALGVGGLQMAKKSSYAGQCIGNLRQIAVGTQVYLTDHRNKLFPEEFPTGNQVDAHGYWLRAVRQGLNIPFNEPTNALPQSGITKSFICPAHPSKGGWVKHGAPAGTGLVGDEAVTGFAARSYIPNRYLLSRTLTVLPQPSQVIIFVEFPWDLLGTRAYWRGDRWSDAIVTKWHNGMVHCLFADFSIRAIPADTLRLSAINDRLWYPNYPELPFAQ